MELKDAEQQKDSMKSLEKEKEKVENNLEIARHNVQMMQNRIKGLKDMMDKVIVRLVDVKREILKLKEQNQDLEAENNKLHIRAARGFEDLTPRPDYKKLEEDKQFELPIFDRNGKRQIMSTIDIVNELIKKANFIQDITIKDAPKKKRDLRLTLSRKDSMNSDEGTGTPKLKSIFKREPGGALANKISLFTNTANKDNSNVGTPRSDSSKRRSFSKRDSSIFSTPELVKKGEESPSSSDEMTTALLNNKYTKSTFSTHKNVISQVDDDDKAFTFGSKILKETQTLMDDVITAKNHLKNIGDSLE